jgi:MFS family permease
VWSVAGLSVASGLAAFSVTAVIGDVAAAFGQPAAAEGELAEIGLPVTTVGVALAVVRLASLGSLPLAALADRRGRRRVLLTVAAVGLAVTSLAAAAPGFWWYVVLVALARPALAAINAIAGVVAAEESSTADRAGSIALVTAGYGLGSGIVSVGRGLLGDPSFRAVTAFVLVPLLLLPVLARFVQEPALASSRTAADGRTASDRPGLPGAVPRYLRRRVAVLATLVGMIAVATGPGFTYLFVYGERVLGASPLQVSGLVLAAGPVGLAGILLGRWGADRVGRRLTGALAMAGTGLGVTLAYSGGFVALSAGYLSTILLASAFAPAQGTLAAELVPTSVRATVAGWLAVTGVIGAVVGLTAFGVLADVTGGFGAAAALGLLVTASAAAFALLPETRGVELADLEDDAQGGHGRRA